jgi:pyruvate, water dikinase
VRFRNLFFRKRPDGVEVLRARFARFRHLLEMNNRVLRLIADANEKLGGEYLFDARYLQSLEADLGEAVTAAVRDLAEISGNRYPRLMWAFERARAAVRASLEPQRVTRDMPLTLNIEELGTELADVAGEKMARLGEIRRRLMLTVPDGFVITARACEQVLAHRTVASEFEAYREGRDGSAAKLQAAILSAPIPAQVGKAVKQALGRFGRSARFAVRSSALGEDADVSFAGQHATVLNVPRDRVLDAWRRVVASLFSAQASEYRHEHGLSAPAGDMAVGCLLMVPATAAGVLYTVDPSTPQSGKLVVSAVRGLGVPVVEGRGAADAFRVSRALPHSVVVREIADKAEMWVTASAEGTRIVPAPMAERTAPAVSDETLARLAEDALRIERHMKCPQDIEWAIDRDDKLVVLQARPLRLGPAGRPQADDVLSARDRYRVLMQGCGQVACRGIGAGRVFVVGAEEATDGFLAGDVLVTQFASPRLTALVANASAIVSEVGSVTGHLATVAREYRVPTIVGARDATRALSAGTLVTVDADDNRVYEGRVEELLQYQLLRSQPYEETAEFRILRRMLRHVAPLHVRDPSAPGFSPEYCQTYHDIIRFAHERALAEFGYLDVMKLEGRGKGARNLELEIPLDLVVIDLGGGLAVGVEGDTIAPNQVTSRPLTLLLEGLLAPGVWSTNPADMDLEGFMASATRAGPLTLAGGAAVRRNVALVSADYLNLNLRVGYHFNVVDSYLSPNPEDSYVFFRFVGGVTDVTRRTRRARLLAEILKPQGFKTELSGELIVGRLQGVPQPLCEDRLRMVGRLIGFSRQLDILLRDDETVDRLVDAFLLGEHEMALRTLMKEREDADRC